MQKQTTQTFSKQAVFFEKTRATWKLTQHFETPTISRTIKTRPFCSFLIWQASRTWPSFRKLASLASVSITRRRCFFVCQTRRSASDGNSGKLKSERGYVASSLRFFGSVKLRNENSFLNYRCFEKLLKVVDFSLKRRFIYFRSNNCSLTGKNMQISRRES